MERDLESLRKVQSEYENYTPEWWYLQGYWVALGDYTIALVAANDHPTLLEGYYDACSEWEITPREPQ